MAPRYGGASLVNLVATIAGHFGLDTGQPPLEPQMDLSGVRRVVVIVCDALGLGQLRYHLDAGALPGLRRLFDAGHAELREITSVFPSTTVAALSTLHTGLPPAVHGYLGFSVWLGSGPEVTDLLLARERHSHTPRPVPAGPASPYGELAARGIACRIVNAAAFTASALSRWHFSGAEYRAWRSANTLPTLIADAVETRGAAYCWAYWPEHDSVCHVHGPCGSEAGDELAAFDFVLERLLRRLPRDGHTALLILGDHGQQALDPERAVLLDQVLAVPPAGGRTAAYLRADAPTMARMAKVADVAPMDAVWAGGWFGGNRRIRPCACAPARCWPWPTPAGSSYCGRIPTSSPPSGKAGTGAGRPRRCWSP